MSRLPKYVPGDTILTNKGEAFVVAYCFVEHGEWHYNSADGEMQSHDDQVIAVLNNREWVPKKIWNSPKSVDTPIDTTLYDKMTETDPDEEKWLNENVRGKEEELRNAQEKQ